MQREKYYSHNSNKDKFYRYRSEYDSNTGDFLREPPERITVHDNNHKRKDLIPVIRGKGQWLDKDANPIVRGKGQWIVPDKKNNKPNKSQPEE